MKSSAKIVEKPGTAKKWCYFTHAESGSAWREYWSDEEIDHFFNTCSEPVDMVSKEFFKTLLDNPSWEVQL